MGLIRLLLAIAVVAEHSNGFLGIYFVGGKIAVQTFYIISGFYMSLVLNEKYINKNSSYKLFITNRLIRLYPIYWTILLMTLLFSISFVILSDGANLSMFESYCSVKFNIFSFSYLVLTNILIFGQDFILYLGINPETGNLFYTNNFLQTNPYLFSFLFIPQAWSLSLELVFYLLAPFILRRGGKLIITLIMLSFILRLYLFNKLGYNYDPWTYRFFSTELMFFLLGYVSYKISTKINKITIAKPIVIIILAYILIFTIIFQFIPKINVSYFPFSINEMMYFISILFSIPVLFNSMKDLSLDNQIGELSYPVYISHMMIIMIVNAVSIPIIKSGVFITFTTLIVSYLLNKLVALPIEKYRRSRLR